MNNPFSELEADFNVVPTNPMYQNIKSNVIIFNHNMYKGIDDFKLKKKEMDTVVQSLRSRTKSFVRTIYHDDKPQEWHDQQAIRKAQAMFPGFIINLVNSSKDLL